MRAGRSIVAAVALVAALAACSAPGVSAEYEPGGGEYVSGDGTTHFWPAGERGEPIVFSGDTETGDTLSSEDLAGRVVLINFWYASCGPCRTEVLDLNDLYDDYADDLSARRGGPGRRPVHQRDPESVGRRRDARRPAGRAVTSR